jgi:polyphosphate kinase
MKEKKVLAPTQGDFINRELSWLAFNERVLAEAARSDNPVLERMKFLSIVSSNFEEFFMIRVAVLKKQKEAKVTDHSLDLMTPEEQLASIRGGRRAPGKSSEALPGRDRTRTPSKRHRDAPGNERY